MKHFKFWVFFFRVSSLGKLENESRHGNNWIVMTLFTFKFQMYATRHYILTNYVYELCIACQKLRFSTRSFLQYEHSIYCKPRQQVHAKFLTLKFSPRQKLLRNTTVNIRYCMINWVPYDHGANTHSFSKGWYSVPLTDWTGSDHWHDRRRILTGLKYGDG